jgi:geranylgeranylglycerol-phosphate geranylgeranyltransferase
MNPYVTLFRPVNFIITAAAIFTATLLAGGTEQQMMFMIVAALGGGLIAGGAMVINDVLNVEYHRLTDPERPIARGAVDQYDAMMFYGALTGAGLIMCAYTTRNAFIIAFVACPVIVLYAKVLTRSPLFGNIIVGALAATAFLFGGAVVGAVRPVVMPALFVFLLITARGIIAGMKTAERENNNGASLQYTLVGMQRASAAVTILLLSFIISTAVPFMSGQYGIRYLLGVSVGADLAAAYVIVTVWKDRSEKNLALLEKIIGGIVVAALSAMYFG